MTSEAVFIEVGALADGFAPHGNLLATASLPAGENFTFYVAGSEPQQLVIEDEQTLSWNGKRAPGGRPPCARTFCLSTSLTRSGITPALARYAT